MSNSSKEMSEKKEQKGLPVNVRSFIFAIVIIFALMVMTYVLTVIIPGGEFVRTVDELGKPVLDTDSYHAVEGNMPFWKWVLSPILVLGAEGSGMLIAIIAFLLVIGGIFNSLDKCGFMRYMLDKLVNRFGESRYKLMAVMVLFFMLMGAFVGSFEECVPLVPIVVALALNLGWDRLTGVGMSLLAVGCGFASGICNPFTIGVAQNLAGLPMFSGIWLRIVAFILIYALLIAFLFLHAKKVEKPVTATAKTDFVADSKMDKGLFLFALILGIGITVVLSSAFITALQDYTMIIIAVAFLVAGIAAAKASGMEWRPFGTSFGNGALSILPAVGMILMASSIKYTLEEGKVLDTVLNAAISAAKTMPTWVVILFIYLIVLIMNFFIGSGSAKAFLLIPIIAPLAQYSSIPVQLCVVAFAFGDGFSNVLYPTNAALLISLGLGDVGYGEWFRYSWKFQLANLLLTSGILLLGLAVGYC